MPAVYLGQSQVVHLISRRKVSLGALNNMEAEMSKTIGVVLLILIFLLGLVSAGETVYYSRRATRVRPKWKGRIWTLGILGSMISPAFILLWIPDLVPHRELWNVPLCGLLIICGVAAVTHRILLRRVLGTSFLGPLPLSKATRTDDRNDRQIQ
jgi:hypothetical protein